MADLAGKMVYQKNGDSLKSERQICRLLMRKRLAIEVASIEWQHAPVERNVSNFIYAAFGRAFPGGRPPDVVLIPAGVIRQGEPMLPEHKPARRTWPAKRHQVKLKKIGSLWTYGGRGGLITSRLNDYVYERVNASLVVIRIGVSVALNHELAITNENPPGN